MALIAVLYDTESKKLLGRSAKWYSLTEFEKSAPRSSEDMIPPEHPPAAPDPDPGPTYKCINGMLHVCSGTRCYPLGARC
jgi:hypothetical protein